MESGIYTIEAAIVFPLVMYSIILVLCLVIILNERYVLNFKEIENILYYYQKSNDKLNLGIN